MSANYVYIKVKLNLKDGQSEESIQSIVSEVDYSFNHDQILSTEIAGIHDFQVAKWFFDYVVFYTDSDGKEKSQWFVSDPYETEKAAKWDAMAFAENTEVTEPYYK